MIDIVLLYNGAGIEEATITRWLKTVGNQVTEGEVIVEVETVKATIEIEAPANGTLAAIIAPDGATVEVNSVIGTIAS
ncbi:biotin/lipoyl-containing protein [Mesorhizobium sp. M0590]|uniref:biotin/lipoyl-containing protein n=1 Tax=Mesorhizobium sp. M0590 TaxID=2956966 RepID=UPI003336BBF8